MITLGNHWDALLQDEFHKEYYLRLRHFLKQEYANRRIYPKMDDIFNAVKTTDYPDVSVVILGQDPYHGPNQAHGFAFRFSRMFRFLLPCKIFIRNCMTMSAVIFPTTVTFSRGQNKVFFF